MRRYEVQLVRKSADDLDRVKDSRGRSHHYIRTLSCYYRSVIDLYSHDRCMFVFFIVAKTVFLHVFMRPLEDRPVFYRDAKLVHEELAPGNGIRCDLSFFVIALRDEISSDDLLAGRLAAYFVISDAESGAVDAHVGRRLVFCLLARDPLNDPLQDREDLEVAVVVDRRLAVSFKMEGVDHVDILQVGRRRLVSDIHRMLQRKAPDREGLELGVARRNASQLFVVELGEACRQLAGAAARGVDDYDRLRHFDVRIRSVSLFAYYSVDICRITLREAVLVRSDAAPFEPADEHVDSRLVFVPCDHDAVDRQLVAAEHIYYPEDFHIISDAEILTRLVRHDVSGIYADDYLRLVLQSLEKLDLRILVESREHPHGVLVLDKLAAELKVEPLALVLIDPFKDIL